MLFRTFHWFHAHLKDGFVFHCNQISSPCYQTGKGVLLVSILTSLIFLSQWSWQFTRLSNFNCLNSLFLSFRPLSLSLSLLLFNPRACSTWLPIAISFHYSTNFSFFFSLVVKCWLWSTFTVQSHSGKQIRKIKSESSKSESSLHWPWLIDWLIGALWFLMGEFVRLWSQPVLDWSKVARMVCHHKQTE